MSELKNAKHEKFAQLIADGMCASQAYEDAGYTPNRQNASRLMTKDDIQRRIIEIRSTITEKAIEKIALSKEWVIREFIDTYHHARDLDQPSAAAACLKSLGVEAGMFTERSDNKNEDVTPEQQEIRKRLKADLKLVSSG